MAPKARKTSIRRTSIFSLTTEGKMVEKEEEEEIEDSKEDEGDEPNTDEEVFVRARKMSIERRNSTFTTRFLSTIEVAEPLGDISEDDSDEEHDLF